MELVRSDLAGPGIRRRRCGRGFTYLGPDSGPVRDQETLTRIRSLVIPPAWEDVWICAGPDGHIQAVGTDAAGRRQYRYHDLWRQQRDQDKHDRVLEFGARLPRLRTVICRHLEARGLGRDRVLAAAIRLIDLGFFRPGGEEYAEENGTFGLATIRKEHVMVTKGQLVFEYTAKGAKHREQAVAEDQVCAAVRSLRRRRGGGEQLLVYRSGPRWYDATAADTTATGARSPGRHTPRTSQPGTRPCWLLWVWPVSEGAAATSEAARKLGRRPVAAGGRRTPRYLALFSTSFSKIGLRLIKLYQDGTTIASVLGELGKDNSSSATWPTRGLARQAAALKLLSQSAQQFSVSAAVDLAQRGGLAARRVRNRASG